MKMFQLMKQYVTFHHPIILIGLKDLTPMFLSIEMMVPFFIHLINGIHGTKPSGRQYNRLLDAVVTIIRYNKSTIDHTIYINAYRDVTV